MLKTIKSTLFFPLVLCGLTCCERDREIQVYRVEKDAESAAPDEAPDAPSDPGSSPATPDDRITWDTPPGWSVAADPGRVRHATLYAGDAEETRAEMAITRFPGDVGGDLANVNRWRNQIGLPPVAAGELGALITPIAAGPKTLSLVDLANEDTRVVTAWTRHGADTWFFKFSGPAGRVAAERENFDAFIRSIRFPSSE